MVTEAGIFLGSEISQLLTLFEDRIPDTVAHSELLVLCRDPEQWRAAKRMHGRIRQQLMESNDHAHNLQYTLAERVLETLYNETAPPDPFETATPFWVLPSMHALAKKLDIPFDQFLSRVRIDA